MNRSQRRAAAHRLDAVFDMMAVSRTYRCADCGEKFFLGPVATSPGFGPVDEDAMAVLIVGSPPRCYDCRTRP